MLDPHDPITVSTADVAKPVPPDQAPTEVVTYRGPESDLDLLVYAWGIIANAGGGDWDIQTAEWVQAAERWRDRYHARISQAAEDGEEPAAETLEQFTGPAAAVRIYPADDNPSVSVEWSETPPADEVTAVAERLHAAVRSDTVGLGRLRSAVLACANGYEQIDGGNETVKVYAADVAAKIHAVLLEAGLPPRNRGGQVSGYASCRYCGQRAANHG